MKYRCQCGEMVEGEYCWKCGDAIIQLHRERLPDLHHELVAQSVYNGFVERQEFRDWLVNWVADVSTRHPLEEGWQWLVVSSTSEKFFWSAGQEVRFTVEGGGE